MAMTLTTPQTEGRKFLNRAFSQLVEGKISEYDFFLKMHKYMDMQYHAGRNDGMKFALDTFSSKLLDKS